MFELRSKQTIEALKNIRKNDPFQGTTANDDYTNQDPSTWKFYRYEKLVAAAREVVLKLTESYDAIIGIARSGIVPATYISHATHTPLYLMDQVRKELVPLGGGNRTKHISKSIKKVLLVDDSCYSGHTITSLRNYLIEQEIQVTTAACIVRPVAQERVNIYGVLQPSPHFFEWHMPNSTFLTGRMANPALKGGLAFDFDGVLCADVPAHLDTDDEKYANYIANAPLLMRPVMHPIKLIVTFRLEKYREITEAWLKRWGISCEKLIMYPAATMKERKFDAGTHKGIPLKESTCFGMIESCKWQARDIAKTSGKPVICYTTGEVFYNA